MKYARRVLNRLDQIKTILQYGQFALEENCELPWGPLPFLFLFVVVVPSAAVICYTNTKAILNETHICAMINRLYIASTLQILHVFYQKRISLTMMYVAVFR